MLLLVRIARLLPGRHLLGQLFCPLTQVGLIACERFELALQLLCGHLGLLARKLLLTFEELVLPLSQVLYLVQDASRGLIILCGALGRLVIGLLRPLELFVEQRRDVVVAVVVGGTALS